MNFKSNLNEIKKGIPKFKLEYQKIWIMFLRYDKELSIFLEINLFCLLSDARYKVKHGKGLKILAPKQMPQKLLISLAQAKPNNTSENLLNETFKWYIPSVSREKSH